MTLCRLMQADFKGELEGMSPEDAYSIANLKFGISYAEGWLALGHVRDEIGNFDLKEFKNWCETKLKERGTNPPKTMYEQFSKLVNNATQKAFYEWVLRQGVCFRGRTLTHVEEEWLQSQAGDKLYTPKLCFYQSQMIAVGSSLRYFEGQATTKSLQLPLSHGWLVDENNKVWETTWKDGLDYFGVEIPTEFVRKSIFKTGEAQPLLGRYYGEVIEK